MSEISRREAMFRVGLLMGGVMSAPALSLLSGCQPKSTPEEAAALFSDQHQRLIAEIAELIIPTTNTPGAKEAGVPQFVQVMLTDCYPEEDQKRFNDGLDQLDKDSEKGYKAAFLELNQPQQVEILTKLEQDARQFRTDNPDEAQPFFLMMKELTLLGYFSSEPGVTQALTYSQVPGSYSGCTTLEAGQKTWAI